MPGLKISHQVKPPFLSSRNHYLFHMFRDEPYSKQVVFLAIILFAQKAKQQ